MFPTTAVGEIAAVVCPKEVAYSASPMQKKRNENPAREESKPVVQYQQKKSNDEARIVHGSSIRSWETSNAVQVYILEGRSRIS